MPAIRPGRLERLRTRPSHRDRAGQRRTKSAPGPPGVLLALASSCGQRRTEAVIRGQNPIALASLSAKTAKRIGGVPWTMADKRETSGTAADDCHSSIQPAFAAD